MLEIYCFDIGALLILVTMFGTIFFRKMTKGRLNGIFMQLVSVTLTAGVCDIIANALNGVTTVPDVFKYVVNSCFYICRALGFFLYARYIIDLSDTRHIFNKRWFKWIAKPPVMIAFICTIVTYFNHAFYYYSSKGYFIRGKWNVMFYVLCGGYALFAFLAIIKNRKYFGIARSISLASVCIFSAITAFIQYSYPYIVIDILGFAGSLLFIMLFINNPDEKADSVAQLKNYRTYIDDMTRGAEIEKPAIIIFINVLNFPALEQMISFDNFFTLAREVAQKIRKLDSEFKTHSDMYYLRNGRFRMVFLENELKESRLNELLDRMLTEFNCEMQVNETSVYIESNICISKALDDFATFEELSNFGGLLDKEEKKDYVIYADSLLSTAEYDMITKLDEIMERGILNNTFEVYYQPIYSVKEQKFTHAEALLRLFDTEFGLIDPESIIQAAETNGAINKIGKIVIEEVCRFISSDEFKLSGLTAIAINTSIIELMQKNFANDFISILQSYNVRADQLIIEITESEASENQKSVIDNIETLAKNGTKFSLNNYGTGYSNITTTSSLPLASSKLDRKLINSKYNDKLDVIIVNSIKLLKSLGRTVVVVGVESEEVLKKYEELEVDYIQGYYFTRPLQKSDFVFYMNHHNNNNVIR